MTLVDGRYRVLSLLGSGGMADVYEAEDTQLGRRIALKLLHRRYAADPEFVERFRREASAAAGLSHPNIVGIYDRGRTEDTYYIAMELIDGRNLKEIVRDHGALDPPLAVEIVLQILAALGFAHARGVVHRDIKPQNVLVDAAGVAKVTDFGIARAGSSDMTETGSILGTAKYLAPEQAQGHPVDARADLYSTGVVLYELLCGTTPFDGDSPVAIALKQVSEQPLPPRQRNPAVAPELDAVVLRALRKDPNERFQDASAFERALELAMAGEPPPPPGDLADELAASDDRGRRRFVLWAVVALALVALCIGTWQVVTPDEKTVPDVSGKRSEVATRQLNRAGFEVDVVEVESSSVDRGRVVSQSPGARARADEGTVVTISVSGGPGEATIPPVAGRAADEAIAQISDAGFEVRERREYSDTVRRGSVIASLPAEGATLRLGATVTLVISRGVRRVVVPDVTGTAVAQAETALDDLGLRARVTEEQSDQAQPGTVLSQDPAAGARLAQGKTVLLVVATAPDTVTVTVPGVIDASEQEARDALEQAGFEVEVREETVQQPEQEGIVLAQTPEADAEAESGSRVVIMVGRYSPPDEEPAETPTPTPSATP